MNMKNLVLVLSLLFSLGVSGQVKDYVIHAVDVLETDSVLVINGDTVQLSAPADGQFIRRVSGKWVNQNFSAAGTDSLLFDPIYGRLYDYRGGSIYRTTQMSYEDFTLDNGGTRTITIRFADGGQLGNDLVIKAGDNDDNIGGGDLYIRGGGTLEEFGDVHIGASLYDETNSSLIQVHDTIYMNGNAIRGLSSATHTDEPVTLGQLTGLTKAVYSISLPYSTTIQGRINGATQGTDYPSTWSLAAASNQIDMVITHNTGRRVAEVNVMSVVGTKEQLLRPFAGAYSGWETDNVNTLTINSISTIPLPIRIYVIFE
jgi:hypothetical protein